MIFPISHEQTTVRNFPWATALLIAALFGSFLLTPRDATVTEASQRLSEVLSFSQRHPHLEVDPRVTAATGHRPQARAAPEAGPRELLQRELDERTDAWLAALKENPYYHWGLIPAAPRPVAFLSYLFLHSGWLHLGLNLLWLYLCAPFVEDRWGTGAFLAFFFAVGAVAAALFLLRDPGAFVPLIGASGAIAGVLAAFLVLHGRTKMDFAFLLPIFGGTFSAPVWLMIPIWFGFDFWAVLTQGAARGGGTAHWAHLGGFFAGLAVALAARLARGDGSTPESGSRPSERPGSLEEGWRQALLAARENPADSVLRDRLWDLAGRLGRRRQTVPTLYFGVRQALRTGAPAEALDRWQELRRALPDMPVDPGLAVDLAAAARRLRRDSEARELLESALGDWREDTPFPIAERALHLARILASPRQKAFLDIARNHPQADPRRRRELEAEAAGAAP